MSAPVNSPIGSVNTPIGPANRPSNAMEEVEYSASNATPSCLPRGTGSDPATGLQVSISLAHEEIVSL
ncbi:unnamed protein product, partial [Umbelopsis sp. WA50703]